MTAPDNQPQCPCTLLLESQPHHPCSPASQAPTPHLGSWAIREMEAKRLAVAAAGQGAVGLRSRGGRRGCTKRLARKASGWEQEKGGLEERTEGEGGGLSKVEEQAGPVSEQVNTKGEAKGGETKWQVVRAESQARLWLTRGEEESLSTPGVGGLRTEVAPQAAASCCTRPRRCPRNLELSPGGRHCGCARENLIRESSVFPSSAR